MLLYLLFIIFSFYLTQGLPNDDYDITLDGNFTIVDDMVIAATPEHRITRRQAVQPDLENIKGCKRWPEGVVLYKNYNVSESSWNMIRKAMDVWEKYSCVRFLEDARNDPHKHLQIYSPNRGCFSTVGRYCIDPTKNHLGLNEDFCLKSDGHALHELAHVLGVYHQQNRPDRDEYVMILPENINPDRIRNFMVIEDALTYGTEYDYCSVTHYGGTAFTRNGNPTLITRDPRYQHQIGQRKGLSFQDIQLVNLMYRCSDACEALPTCPPPPDCFVDEHCICRCKYVNSGASCPIYI